MRKVVKVVFGLVLISLMVSSCSSDQDILSQFSKRKYLKKFKSKDVKYEDNIEKRENDFAILDEIDKYSYASNKKETEKEQVITSVELESTKKVRFNDGVSEELAKVEKVVNDYNGWNKYNREFNHFEMSSISKEYKFQKRKSSSQVSSVVLIILCILIITAPLAVYLYEDAITANFWLDLALLLLVIGAAIYALLVCFADVSI